LLTVICTVSLAGGLSVPSDQNPYAVATFECLGIYFKVDAQTPGDCEVQYRKAGSGEWNKGLPLWFDDRDSEFRGSIVGLDPDTDYEMILRHNGKDVSLKARTRSENFPVGKTTYLEDGVTNGELRITEPGTPDAWHLVTPKDGAKTVIDPENFQDYNVVVKAPYVIVRGLELKNAAIHGILVAADVHDVVIEDCRITHWGHKGGSISLGNEWMDDSAIKAAEGTQGLVIQRNLIEHPRGGSNDWETGHPIGPQAITLVNSKGGNIIRYNEILSSEEHGFNDAIGGASNFSFEGSPNRDSDIYGNIISNAWDDGIESEGANMNVRIWGNYIHHTYQHIAIAATSRGPLYVFRNVFGLSRRSHTDPLGGNMIKLGEKEPYIGGRRYIFHNTALQPSGAFSVFSNHPCTNTITRNNIFDCPGTLTGKAEPAIPSDLDYDLFTGIHLVPGYEAHGVRRKPAYVHSYALEFYLAPTTTKIDWGTTTTTHGDQTLTVTDKIVTIPNPAIDAGEIIPGFNGNFKGRGPDLGAFEVGNPPIKFGRHAVEPHVIAPWEQK
jgi:hypothetical protein